MHKEGSLLCMLDLQLLTGLSLVWVYLTHNMQTSVRRKVCPVGNKRSLGRSRSV